jgi:hypothetical protein
MLWCLSMTETRQAVTPAMGERLRASRRARSLSLSLLSGLTAGLLSKSRISNDEQGCAGPASRLRGLWPGRSGTCRPLIFSALMKEVPWARSMPKRRDGSLPSGAWMDAGGRRRLLAAAEA